MATVVSSEPSRSRQTSAAPAKSAPAAPLPPPAPVIPLAERTAITLPERPTLSLVQPDDGAASVLKRGRGELFVNGVSVDDARQGHLGDCYFICALVAVANAHPEMIRDMVREVGPNLYEVRFYDLATGRPVYQRVTGDLPAKREDGKLLYARSADDNELWPMIVEKAFATRYGGYANVNSGSPLLALSEITGQQTGGYDPMRTNANELWRVMRYVSAQHRPMVATMPQASLIKCKVDAGTLPSDHAYSVIDAYERDGQRWVIVREPHATHNFVSPGYDARVLDAAGKPRPGVFRMKLDDFRSRFRFVGWTTARPIPLQQTVAKPQTTRVRGTPASAKDVQCYPLQPARRPAPKPKPKTWAQSVGDFVSRYI